jgi:demethylmenaquinone methyltransferase/2-methoxy-6-polyprenyl-1,4-benzoquinol methylase
VPDDLDSLLAEQVSSYRARAHEYDATDGVDDESRAQLLNALAAFAPRGRILELACGTGQWTAELARHASSLTAVDASPEMIALNRARVAQENVRYVEADLFAWSARERYDVVFFSAWLSHVPQQRLAGFWALIHDWTQTVECSSSMSARRWPPMRIGSPIRPSRRSSAP